MRMVPFYTLDLMLGPFGCKSHLGYPSGNSHCRWLLLSYLFLGRSKICLRGRHETMPVSAKRRWKTDKKKDAISVQEKDKNKTDLN